MSVHILRRGVRYRVLVWTMLVTVPTSLLGQTPSAILHTQGGVWVNGYEAVDSSSIFAGDLVETKTGFSADLRLEGSTVQLQPETVAKFQGDLLVLEHGSVSVGTSMSFKVRVNCITVVPVQNEWTQYDVTDVNGTVRVAVHKLDVNVEHEMGKGKPSLQSEVTGTGSVHEGEEKSYVESAVCGAPPQPVGSTTGLNPKWIAIGAGAGGGALICALLCHGGGNPPISPKAP